MVTVTQLVKNQQEINLDVSFTFAEAYMEPRVRIDVPVYDDIGRLVADVTGTYVMLRIAEAFQPRISNDGSNADECDQLEPYDALQDAWSRCRTEPYIRAEQCICTETQVQECVRRARTLIDSYGVPRRVEFEVPLTWNLIRGRADCVTQYKGDETIVFEFKCVQELTKRHRTQTAWYVEMLRHMRGGRVRGVLFNVLSNDVNEITV